MGAPTSGGRSRSFGNPYVNPDYGSYYAPQYYYNYWNYRSPYYW